MSPRKADEFIAHRLPRFPHLLEAPIKSERDPNVLAFEKRHPEMRFFRVPIPERGKVTWMFECASDVMVFESFVAPQDVSAEAETIGVC